MRAVGLAEARAKQKPLNEPYQVLSQASGAVAAMPAYGFGGRLEEALVVLHFTPNPLSTKPDQIPSFSNSGKTGGKTPNGNRPAQIDINNFNGMPETSILQA